MDQELKQALEVLGQNWTKLPEKAQKFASDLVLKAKKYDPSPKQATGSRSWRRMSPRSMVAPKPTIALRDFAGVIDPFKRAQKHIQYPKIRLQLSGDRRTGKTSKAPGSAERFGLPSGKKMPKPLKAEAVEPEWEPKLSNGQKTFEADLANEIAMPKIEVNTVAHTAMTDLMSKFEGDAAAMGLLIKLAKLAAIEQAA